jgi:hypothetical protein
MSIVATDCADQVGTFAVRPDVLTAVGFRVKQERTINAMGEAPAMRSGQYAARPEVMRAAVGNVGGLIMRASGTLAAFEQLDVGTVSFAPIGSVVGSASSALQGRQVLALRSLLLLLQSVSSKVQQSADGYQDADRAVAASYSGEQVAPHTGPRIWSSSAGTAVASHAVRDSGTGSLPTPHRAESVIGYLASADLGELGADAQSRPLVSVPVGPVPAGSAADLAAWLADNPAHQAQFGVVAVFEGTARGLDDTPGQLHPGDLVCIEPGADAADGQVTIGVLGDDGGLHNHGRLSPDFGGVAQVHVYRPVSRESGPPGSGSATAPARTDEPTSGMTKQEMPR